jgi:hypothetical protein
MGICRGTRARNLSRAWNLVDYKLNRRIFMSDPALVPELTSYAANCHCGAVKFTVKIPSLTNHQVIHCNCSLCTRNGYLMIYPERKDVVFHSGYDNLSSYSVLHKNIHKFCSICGSSVVAEAIDGVKGDEKDFIAINVSCPDHFYFQCVAYDCGQVRMIKDIDVGKLKLMSYDGRAAKPEYDIGTPADSSTATESELLPYPANCHCGAVRYTIFIPSLEEHLVNMCNCSICTHNGYLLVYPQRPEVIFHSGYDHLRSYFFGSKTRTHKFCPTCGSSILIDPNRINEPGRDILAINVSANGVTGRVSEPDRGWQTRMFHDADPSKFKYKYFDGWTKIKPEYNVS